MKNLILGSFIFFASVFSHAQIKKAYERVKQAVTGSAKLAQLHYFPEQWEADLNVGYRYQKYTIQGKNAGLTAYEFDQTSSEVDTTLTMGVLDHVAAVLKIKYVIDSEINFSKPASQPSTNIKGVGNPTLGTIVRVFDGDGVKLDGLLEFTADVGEHKEADSSNYGDALDGRHTVMVGTSLTGLITKSSQVKLNFKYSMLGPQTSIDQTTNVKTETDQKNQTNFEILTLTELTSDLFFGLEFDYLTVEGYKSIDLGDLSTTDYGSTTAQALNLIGKYQLNADSLIEVQAGYLLGYNGEASGVDLSASAYTTAVNYLIRF